MPKVSFLMPAFNAEKYISQAIEAAIAQTFSDWELIIVDDCSTDATHAIASKYAESDSRIRVLRMEKNSGSSYLPRLTAAKNANGEFLSQLDADDSISADSLELLVATQEATGADIVYPELHILGGEKQLPAEGFDCGKVYKGADLVKYTLNGWQISCAGGLVAKDLYLDNVCPDANHRDVYIDEVETRMMVHAAQRVAFCPAKYFYRENPDSITRVGSMRHISSLESDLVLHRFICANYAKGSEEYVRMMEHRYANIVASMHYVASHNFRPKQTREAWEKIRAAAANLDFSCLAGKMPLLMLTCMRLSFSLAKGALRTKHYLMRRYKQ